MPNRPSRTGRRAVVMTLWTLAALVVVSPAASAYIDPATTGMLFSGIVAGLAAAGTAITMFWSRIIGFFRRQGAGDADAE